MTDDDIRDRFHARLDAVLAPLQPPPSLLRDVHRARRRQRTMTTLAATGVTIGVTAAVAIPLMSPGHDSRDTATATASPTSSPGAGPVVRVLSYDMHLPSGYRVTVQPHVVDLTNSTPRPQPVAGTTATFAAVRGAERLDVTIYRGGIAAAEKSVMPPAPQNVQHATINGHTLTIDPYGTPPAGCKASQPALTHTTSPTPQTSTGMREYICRDGRAVVYPTDEPVESRIAMPNGDLIWIETAGMPVAAVRDLLATLIP